MRIPITNPCARALQLALALALPASAARLAYEGFDYTEDDGTSLTGLDGGSGWEEAFPSGTGGRLNTGLSFTGFTTAGKGAVYNTGQTHTSNGRNWAPSITSGTYWYSFLLRPESDNTFYGRGTFGILQNGSGTDNQNGFGVRFDPTPEATGSTTLRFWAHNPNQGTGAAIDFANGFNQTYLVIGRLDVDIAANTTNSVWIYQDGQTVPATEAELPGAMSTTSLATSNANPAIYGRAFGGGLTNADFPIRYDEVRVSTTYAEVFPSAGEPEFSLNPATAIENQTLTFSWINLPADSSPTLNGIGVAIDGSGNGGTTLPAPAVNTTYTLAWTGEGSPLTQQFTAIAPSFAIDTASGYLGDNLTLNWRVPVGSTDVTLNPGDINLTSETSESNGIGTSTIPAPSETTEYTLSYTFGGMQQLNADFTLLPSFVAATPANAINTVSVINLTWRIDPNFDEDAGVTLEAGPLGGPYDTFDVLTNTNTDTGAGSVVLGQHLEDEEEYRILYEVEGLTQEVSTTINVFPKVYELGSVTGNAGAVLVNSEPMFDGVLAYGDRGHVWAAVPSIMQGAQFIRLTQADRPSANLEINVTAELDGTFFLLIDNRVGDGIGGNDPASGTNDPPTLGDGVMDWVLTSGFVDSGVDIGLDENPVASEVTIDQSYSVFFRQVSQGEMFTFFEQNDGTGRNMYGIAAVSPQVTPVAFAVNPSVINQGEDTLLQWTVPTGFTSVTLNPGSINVTDNTDPLTGAGNITLSPAATIEYTLTYVVGGSDPVSLPPVTVTVIPAPVIDESFAILAVSVAANGDVTFSWPAPVGVTDPEDLAFTDVIERSTTLEVNSWFVVPIAGATITDGVVSFTDTEPPSGGKAFYRIQRP